MRRFLRGQKREPRGIMLIDWDNLLINLRLPSPDEVSLIGGFDKVIKDIAREFGEIIDVFVFLPPQPAYIWGETLHKLNFYPIVCPKITDKEGEEQDTVDDTLIRFGERDIENTKNLSFLCLGSGDKDFSPLVRRAMRRGLKIVVVAGSTKSLASELIDLADRIFIFEPTKAS